MWEGVWTSRDWREGHCEGRRRNHIKWTLSPHRTWVVWAGRWWEHDTSQFLDCRLWFKFGWYLGLRSSKIKYCKLTGWNVVQRKKNCQHLKANSGIAARSISHRIWITSKIVSETSSCLVWGYLDLRVQWSWFRLVAFRHLAWSALISCHATFKKYRMQGMPISIWMNILSWCSNWVNVIGQGSLSKTSGK